MHKLHEEKISTQNVCRLCSLHNVKCFTYIMDVLFLSSHTYGKTFCSKLGASIDCVHQDFKLIHGKGVLL